MKLNRKYAILICVFLLTTICAQKPLSDSNGVWSLLVDYSDEFNSTSGLDLNKWDNNINDWGVWTWEPQNAWLDGNGFLHIKMINEQHVRGGSTYYFKSGAIRQYKTISFGYFEARIKGCPTFPGVCPAFWMYSMGQSFNNVTYNEIDFMEVQQRQFDIKGIDCNTHYSINGAAWVNTKNYYSAPFAPNDGFHVYGCNVTPSNITFYIDGVQVAKNDNQYFFLPMNIIFSMGVRPPLMEYGPNGEKLPVVVLNNPGFPTEMLVDYLRVWTAGTSENIDIKTDNSNIEIKPNPIVNEAVVSFNVVNCGLVNITIYNELGNCIKKILYEYKNPGIYSVNLKKNDLGNPGMYICRIMNNNKSYTKAFFVY